MATAAVVSTLRHVTDRKFQKISEQQLNFSKQKEETLRNIAAASTSTQKIEALLAAFEKYELPTHGVSTDNVRRFLDQAKHDSTISDAVVSDWIHRLMDALDIGARKYHFASLFGRLVNEWLEESGKAAKTSFAKPGVTDLQDDFLDSGSLEGFEKVGRAEMHEQRQLWESYTFNERPLDKDATKAYLHNLFEQNSVFRKFQVSAFQDLRKTMGEFKLPSNPFSEHVVKSCIEDLLKTNHFTGQKRESLIELKEKSTILKEMADILNMDFASLTEWKWDPAPVTVFMRRQLNGKYRVFMDEEVHQAILLHFIGSHFAVHIKNAFQAFHQKAWNYDSRTAMNKMQRQRRSYFLGSDDPTSSSQGSQGSSNYVDYGNGSLNSLPELRRAMYRNAYFMQHLPSKVFERTSVYDDAENPSSETSQRFDQKQLMLRLITTEMLLNTKINGELTIWQSDFKMFGPSLPHDAIFAVLDYLGVEAKWQALFHKFLEAPLLFQQDGPGADVRVRKRGIPMSNAMSEALSEAVLFCLDFAINQKTGGSNIWRFHDDMWFWGKEDTCVKAWQTLAEFCKVMGLELNEKKTAAALIVGKDRPSRQMSSSLPNGTIRWGFLTLDPASSSWIVDRDQVEEHIKEIRLQLNACTSVFGWIQAWNSYVSRFLSSNFGLPAKCLGRPHVAMLIETFKHVQHSLFGANGNAVSYLRTKLESRFDAADVPDAFFYFPVSAGGLGLRNPFIPLLTIGQSSKSLPSKRIDQALDFEVQDYEAARETYNSNGLRGDRVIRYDSWKPADPANEPFFSLKEYTESQEATSIPLLHAYRDLLELSKDHHVKETDSTHQAMLRMCRVLPLNSKNADIHTSWSSMEPYWKWVLQLYAADVEKNFGGLDICDRGVLPMGIVNLLRSEKVQWQG